MQRRGPTRRNPRQADIDERERLLPAACRWKLVHGPLAVEFIAAAIVAFVDPGNTFAALEAVFGFSWRSPGHFDIVVAISVRHEMNVWWF
jgi:uncharacterized membrane protein HdeD (DUF308 family)